jgi:hypothetical protein
LSIAVEGEFPTAPVRIIAYYRDQLYDVSFADGTLKRSGPGVPWTTFLGSSEMTNFIHDSQSAWSSQPERTEEENFRGLFAPLVARALELDPYEADGREAASQRVRLFVYAPMPEGFSIQNARLGKQQGFVLYCTDVFLPENP